MVWKKTFVLAHPIVLLLFTRNNEIESAEDLKLLRRIFKDLVVILTGESKQSLRNMYKMNQIEIFLNNILDIYDVLNLYKRPTQEIQQIKNWILQIFNQIIIRYITKEEDGIRRIEKIILFKEERNFLVLTQELSSVLKKIYSTWKKANKRLMLNLAKLIMFFEDLFQKHKTSQLLHGKKRISDLLETITNFI